MKNNKTKSKMFEDRMKELKSYLKENENIIISDYYLFSEENILINKVFLVIKFKRIFDWASKCRGKTKYINIIFDIGKYLYDDKEFNNKNLINLFTENNYGESWLDSIKKDL